MKKDIAINVNNVSKEYKLYKSHADRVKEALHPFRKKYHHSFLALNNISITVKKGEFFGIIGRNGSGKSTLLQLICGILQPTTGSVITNGRIAALLELGAGFNPEFTGRENVYLNGELLGFSKKAMDLRFEELVDFAEIGEFINQPVKTYSSGMYVRLAFAVQACVDPDVLVVDEALAVGDIFFRQKCYKRLQILLDNGCTVLFVSHSMNDIEQFCQRALFLHNGEEFFLGPASEAVKRYYLLEQKRRTTTDALLSVAEKTAKSIPSIDFVDQSVDFFWPSANAFFDISHVVQVSNGWATCTKVAVCDDAGHAKLSFLQGETSCFFYEFQLNHEIEVPTGGVEFLNDKNLIVHGKSTVEYGTQVPVNIKRNEYLRFKQNIVLDIAPGEYTFNIGMGALPIEIYKNISIISYHDMDSAMVRVCLLPSVGRFTVMFGTNGQLLHHGVANLPGTCNVALIPQSSII